MPKRGDLIPMIGRRFGRLVVEALGRRLPYRRYLWTCLCDCGNRVEVEGGNLRTGNSQSCGCLHLEVKRLLFTTHGHAPVGNRSPEYESWCAMWGRVRDVDPDGSRWRHYGRRGIVACDRWLSFEAFLADMGPRPSLKHSLDRVNNDGNYEPGNCRWATDAEQVANRRPRSQWTPRQQDDVHPELANDNGDAKVA